MAAQLTATNGPVGPAARAVDGGGHQLLAGAGLAGDEHPGVGRRHLRHQLAHPAERRGGAHHLVPPAERVVQRAVGGLGPGEFQRRRRVTSTDFGRERLFEELEGAQAGGAHGVGQLGLAAHHDDRRRHAALPERLQRLEPVRARRHHEVEEDGIGLRRVDGEHGGISVGGLGHDVPLGAQQRAEHPADVGFVVD